MKDIKLENGWLSDADGNKCSIAYFGSEERAREALLSLEDCKNCINCSRCSRCSGCSRCSDCSGCSDCSDCSRCSRCSRCSDCSDCSDCSGCSDCSDCSDCSRCSGCSDCSGCSGCSDCSRCSRCSGCSRCSRCSGCSRCSDCSRCSRCSGSRCSHIANLYDKKDLRGDPESTFKGAPDIPVIADIHNKVYAAVSQPNALNMTNWHTCNTTHCRAGWVVHLAGEAGYALERFHNTALAAQLIYDASGFDINPCRFYDNNKDALADMEKLAVTTD